MNNLNFYHDRWYKTYKGKIYKNSKTDINTAINNKAIINNLKPIAAILTIAEKLKN